MPAQTYSNGTNTPRYDIQGEAEAKAREEAARKKAEEEAEEARKKAEEEARKKAEREESARKQIADWKARIKDSNERARQQTSQDAVQDSGNASLSSANSFNATGMNKTMAANLGSANLSGNAMSSYTENIDENTDNTWNQTAQQAVLALKAQEGGDTAEYLAEAAEAMEDSEVWMNLANVLGAGLELSNLFTNIVYS